MAARRTFGDHTSAQSALSTMSRTPEAAALRKMVPILPGSCTRSSTTQSPSSGSFAADGSLISATIFPPSPNPVSLPSIGAATETVFSDGIRCSNANISASSKRFSATYTHSGLPPAFKKASKRCVPSSRVWPKARRLAVEAASLARCLIRLFWAEAMCSIVWAEVGWEVDKTGRRSGRRINGCSVV